MSWKPEVIADASGKWATNALRFATYGEALRSAHDLSMRWLAVREYRASECDEPVTHKLVDGRAVEDRACAQCGERGRKMRYDPEGNNWHCADCAA